MAEVNINLKCDLQHAVKVQYLDGNLFSQDAAANTINIEVTDNGAPATIGGTVSANVIRPDGGTVAVTGGTISGNIVSITLPAACYALVGMISVIVKLTSDSTETTIAALTAYVYQSSTDTVVDPGTVISSIQDLIDAIDTAVASIPADYSSLWTSLAPAFSSSTAYTAGQYVTYNGGLYRFTKAHAAGSWASGDVVAVNLGGELSDVKSALVKASEPTTNLWEWGDFLNFTTQADIANIDIPAGTYMISAVVTSSDTSKTVSSMYLYLNDSSVVNVELNRNSRAGREVTVASKITAIRLYSSNSYSNSNGKTASWVDVGIFPEGTPSSYYIPPRIPVDSYARVDIAENRKKINEIYSPVKKVVVMNIADPSEYVANQMINQNGTVSRDQNDRFRTGFIPVEPGMIIYWNSTYVRVITAYDSTKTVITEKGYDYANDGGNHIKSYTVPSGVSYLIISVLYEWVPGGGMNFCAAIYPLSYNDALLDPKKLAVSDFVYPEMFGAIGDNVTDDTQAIQAAIDYAGTNHKELVFLQKSYFITDMLDASYNGMRIRGNGATIRIANTTNETGYEDSLMTAFSGIIKIQGSLGATYPVTEVTRIKSGSSSKRLFVTLEDTTGLQSGDSIRLALGGGVYGQPTSIAGNPDKLYKPGSDIMCTIESISPSGPVLKLDYDSPFDMATVDLSLSFVQKINPISDVMISDIILRNDAPYTNEDPWSRGENLEYLMSGIALHCCKDVVITKIRSYFMQLPTVSMLFTYNVMITNLCVNRPRYIGSGQGYGIHSMGSMGVTIEHIFGLDERHSVDFSYSAFCCCRDLKSSISRESLLGFDLHGIWEHDITFDNMNGSVRLGNGSQYFPCMISNVYILNSTIDQVNLDSYIDNLYFENCDITLDNVTIANVMTFNDCIIRFNAGSDYSRIYPDYAKSHRENVLRINNSEIFNVLGIYGRIQLKDFDYVYITGCTWNGVFMLKPEANKNVIIGNCVLKNTTISPNVTSGKEMNIKVHGCDFVLDDDYDTLFEDSPVLFNLSNVYGEMILTAANNTLDYDADHNFALFSNSDGMTKFLGFVNGIIKNNRTEYQITNNTTDTQVKRFVTDNVIEY